MIGSLMSRMGMAEKLSVAQLQQAVQDGTLPAYIGVPLMQDKMQQEKAAQAAAQGMQQQQQPPIAQQVMQEAQAQDQAQGLEQAQSNLPEQFADGGIINFAKGGAAALMAEDDRYANAEDADDAEMSQLYGSGTDNDLIQAIAASGKGAGIESIHPSAAVSMLSEKEKEIEKGLHKYQSQGIDAAKRIGLNPSLMMHVMQKETGGLKNPETARSSAGAQGVMQFMPATAKQYGINPNLPEEAIPAGAKHLHSLVNHYKGDERLAAMAYNWGQGNVDKWLRNGADPKKVPQETRKYVSSLGGDGVSRMAEGGIASIPRYAGEEESLVNANPELMKEPKTVVTKPAAADATELDRERNRGIATTNVNKRFIESLPKKANKEEKGIEQAVDKETYYQSAPKSTSGIDALQEELLQDIKDRREKAKQTSEMNKYLALMQAGFGMMGSKALVPLQAIGEGAQQGVSSYAGLLKQEGEEAKDIAAQRLGLYKYKSAAEAKAAEVAALDKYRTASLGARPDKEDVEMQRIDKALSINPQIKDLRERMQLEAKNGSLTADAEKRYLDAINKITADIFKNYGRTYNPTNIGTITAPPPPKEPSFWDRITGKGTSPAQGNIPELPPGYKLQ
jgi:soluble lytic murein transglycosylase-like protein